MAALLVMALTIETYLVMNYRISTWFIPVFIFTLELIIKAHTSFAVYYMLKNDVAEGITLFFLYIQINKVISHIFSSASLRF